MLYILNTATLPLKEGEKYIIKARQVSVQQVREMLEKEYYTSAIGHQATAQLLTNILGQEIPFNRIQIQLQPGDRLLAFLLKKRLEEGRVIKTVEELEEIYSSDDPNPCIG